VKFGKNSGQTMARRGLDGRVHQITLITTSSLSCSVAAGNPFQKIRKPRRIRN
jgi:hypothetical protein